MRLWRRDYARGGDAGVELALPTCAALASESTSHLARSRAAFAPSGPFQIVGGLVVFFFADGGAKFIGYADSRVQLGNALPMLRKE